MVRVRLELVFDGPSRWAFLHLGSHPLATLPGTAPMVLKYLHTQPWWTAKNTLGPLRILDFGLFAILTTGAAKTFGSRVEGTSVHHWLCFLGFGTRSRFMPGPYRWIASCGMRNLIWGCCKAGPPMSLFSFFSLWAALNVPALLHALYRRHATGPAPQLAGSNAGCGTDFAVNDLAISNFQQGRAVNRESLGRP